MECIKLTYTLQVIDKSGTSKKYRVLICIKILAKSLVAQLTPLDVSNGVVQGSNPPLPLYLLNLYCIKMPLVNSEHVC